MSSHVCSDYYFCPITPFNTTTEISHLAPLLQFCPRPARRSSQSVFVRLSDGRRRGRKARQFCSRLDQILDMGHAKVVLASRIDWQFLSKELGAVYTDGPGQPPLPARLMAGLHILKHADNLSDEKVCGRWLENPYYQ